MTKRKKLGNKVSRADWLTVLGMVAAILGTVLFLVSRSAWGDDKKYSNWGSRFGNKEGWSGQRETDDYPTQTPISQSITPVTTPATEVQGQKSSQSDTPATVLPTETIAPTVQPAAPTPEPTAPQTVFQKQPATVPAVVQPEIKTVPIARASVVSSAPPSVSSGGTRTGAGAILKAVKKKIESIGGGALSLPTVTPIPTPTAKPETTKPELNLNDIRLRYQVREGQVVLAAEDDRGMPVAVSEGDMRRAEISALGKLEKKGVTLSLTSENQLALSNNGITAVTDLPIMVDTESRSVVVDTTDGPQTVVLLPDKVLTNLVDLGVISGVDTKVIPKIEYTDGEVIYEFGGNKSYKVLGLYEVSIPIAISVSAETGEVVPGNQSWLARIVRLVSI